MVIFSDTLENPLPAVYTMYRLYNSAIEICRLDVDYLTYFQMPTALHYAMQQSF